MSFCLPVEKAKKFIEALKNGEVDPGKLASMTSEERHEFFAKLVGEKDALDVNSLFESKLLLKNQRAGLVRWAKQVSGITEATRRDMLNSIAKMDNILQPGEEESFLKDLASKKLGASVTADEAQKITDLSKKAQDLRDAMQKTTAFSKERTAYGNAYQDLMDYVNSLKPTDNSWGQWASQILNLPRTALTSVLHFSAPFVQGWGMMGAPHYIEAWGEQFKYFASEQAYKDLQASILGHPDYKFARDGKLGITDIGDKLSTREEAIQSSLLQKIPGIGHLAEASGRGFTGFLNYIRFHRFVDLLNAARLNGEDVRLGSPVIKQIASTVNDFTGRGDIPEMIGGNRSSQFLNSVFFSPRKISASIRMLNPVRYVDPRVSATARLGALRQISGAVVATGAILELAHLAGAKVNLNPTSTNFLKAQFGNTTFDVTGGNAIYARLLARLVTNQEVTSSGAKVTLGAKYGSQTRADLLVSFLRDKFAPVASAMADFLYGKDPVGNTFNLYGEKGPVDQSELFNKLTPIALQDFITLANSGTTNPEVWVPALSAIFGVDVQTESKK